ncbi:MAG: secondary thiamine-phosphate synthase enzyme YjbQ [Oscillospiraceae bacterium]|nr:secondary thiamine-phosphate synthase enzyme YjbQ [Oscillospiraceae bacterium]
MKNFRHEITMTSTAKEQFFNLSFEVEECVRKSGISEGICVVFSQHTTSSVFLENDREKLYMDWSELLGSATQCKVHYMVDYASAGKAHMKQILLGASVTIPISGGKLDLGSRQYIMYGDFDGLREKSVVVKIIGE